MARTTVADDEARWRRCADDDDGRRTLSDAAESRDSRHAEHSERGGIRKAVARWIFICIFAIARLGHCLRYCNDVMARLF